MMEILSAIGIGIGSLGGGAILVFAFSSWLGKVWATRIADSERARFARDLEAHRSDLEQLAQEHKDALIRKRDLYARLATSMRVFFKGRESGDDQLREFEHAFDHATLWASEDVVMALGDVVRLQTRNHAKPGSVSNDEMKDAHRLVLNAMRRDCGFPDTRFDYPIVTLVRPERQG